MKIVKPNYKNSIVNVSNSLLNYYGLNTKHIALNKLDLELEANPKHVTLILLDGLGVNVLRRHLKKEDALYKYMVSEISSVFPPTTVAATNAVLLGETPYETGYLGWVQYFEKENSNYTIFLDEDFYDSTRVFSESLTNKYLYRPTIFDRIKEHRKDVNVQVLFPSSIVEGGASTFCDVLDRNIEHLLGSEKTCSYLYWTEPDSTLHYSGVESKDVKEVVENLNSDFENYLKRLPDESLVIVIADHGHINIEEVPFLEDENLVSTFERYPSIEPRCTNFFVKEGERSKFEIAFAKSYGSDYKLYSKDEFMKEGLIGFGEKHPLLDSFIGDYIAVAIGNKMFKLNKDKIFLSHHAGLTEDEIIVPLILYFK